MVYAIRHETTKLDPAGGGPEKTGGLPAIAQRGKTASDSRGHSLLESANGVSDNAAAVANGINRHTVALCVRKFLQFGIDAAWRELPHPGRRNRLGPVLWLPEAQGFRLLLWISGRNALLQSHVRKHCVVAHHPSLLKRSRYKLHRILTQGEVRPHKLRYYVEWRETDYT
jgi:hypothetical protein